MKLTAKMVAFFVIAFGVVLFLFARTQIEQASKRFEADMREDTRSVGRLFRPTIARAWRLEGEEAALYVIRYTNETLKREQLNTSMRVRWVWLHPDATAASRPRIPLPELAPVVRGEELSVPVSDEELLYTYVPVRIGVDGQPPGALEISESMAPLRTVVRRIRRELITTTVALVAVSGLLVIVIGTWLVSRPLQTVSQAADRIGAGDLSTRVSIARNDEIGALARTVNSTARRLERAREKLARETESRLETVAQLRHADRLTSVGTLASGIAHELGTPLAVVSGRARLIADGTAHGEAAIEYAESIARQADKMATIIHQLLDFARWRKVTPTTVNVGDLAEQTISLLSATARKRDVALQLQRAREPVRASADGVQLQQVLTNLILNAVDAMPSGGTVTVEIATATRRRPGPESEGAEPYAVFRVIDQGEGIEARNLERVFEPFFTTKPAGQGTGLGLAVSYGIVAEHGGWIEVKSEVGAGTTFTVYLPLAAPRERH